MLAAAGYEVDMRDLTGEHWTPAGLRAYFAERPVAEWFDPPRRKSSRARSTRRVQSAAALVMLSINPALIKSPLVKINGRCASGLDNAELKHFIATPRGGKPGSGGNCRQAGTRENNGGCERACVEAQVSTKAFSMT